MTKITTTILVFVLTISVFGNDGTYFTRGGIIYPTQESRISLEREILSFSVKDGICNVDILFEFYNPENVDRKLLIGFQAPTNSDIPYEINHISDFKIISDEQILPYTLKAARCEDCELKDPKEFQISETDVGVFVYLFEITFKSGINKINHSYSFPASENVWFDKTYHYILKTGAKWAGGTIKNLTVQFDLGQNKYFYVEDIFGKTANWSIIGSGKVTDKQIYNYDDSLCRMVRILSGKLQIDVKDFKPTKNIDFGIISENSPTIPSDFKEFDEDKAFSIRNLKLFLFGNIEYTKEELRILRNLIYAQYGYVFQSKDLRDYFSQFEWYMPDPNLTMKQIKLTKDESKFIDEILKREKNLQESELKNK